MLALNKGTLCPKCNNEAVAAGADHISTEKVKVVIEHAAGGPNCWVEMTAYDHHQWDAENRPWMMKTASYGSKMPRV